MWENCDNFDRNYNLHLDNGDIIRTVSQNILAFASEIFVCWNAVYLHILPSHSLYVFVLLPEYLPAQIWA